MVQSRTSLSDADAMRSDPKSAASSWSLLGQAALPNISSGKANVDIEP